MGFAFRNHDNCIVCNTLIQTLAGYSIKFTKSHNKEYPVCFACIKETSGILREIKFMDKELLPLLINHKNIFVREAVKNIFSDM